MVKVINVSDQQTLVYSYQLGEGGGSIDDEFSVLWENSLGAVSENSSPIF